MIVSPHLDTLLNTDLSLCHLIVFVLSGKCWLNNEKQYRDEHTSINLDTY